ncbi:Uncharacterised protein [uncultured archaeon]|nr:Uncharacterised protein [uncultured archaeon]
METLVRIAPHGSRGLAQHEAVAAANSAGMRLLSNREFDRRLVLTDAWKGEKGAYPAWSGTCVAFRDEGKALGDAIKYTDPATGVAYVFEVPAQYRKESNAILVVEHGFLQGGRPVFSYAKDGAGMLVQVADECRIMLLQRFPTTVGWYAADNKHGIPAGEEASPENAGARYLWRAKEYVGLLARGWDYNVGYCGIRNVVAMLPPSKPMGALAGAKNAVAALELVA